MTEYEQYRNKVNEEAEKYLVAAIEQAETVRDLYLYVIPFPEDCIEQVKTAITNSYRTKLNQYIFDLKI
ncbi:hypothetical protein [Macrococcus bovicus]|uniref:hypothetical protein n=1 Tax=Macrococcus bovicus TaxID=69968 RepID=UPI0025A5D633|nr:hypothetical protein [Macrococcus bovicus]WJP97099.1 hypothetical protein QSV55_07380 [Macrococcus bovicus]